MRSTPMAAAVAGIVAAAAAAQATDHLPWSREPPGGLKPADVPQLVAVTFDDNFGLEQKGAVGGVRAVLEYYRTHRNPPGTGNPRSFDGAPIRTTFFDTTVYMAPPSVEVVGGWHGEDATGGNLAAWRAAVAAGEEIGDHTVNHLNGGVVPLSADACCRPRNWDTSQWTAEIGAARKMLSAPSTGIGVTNTAVVGFRAPYLGYTDSLFSALQLMGFEYDSSLPNCFGAHEDAGSCGWPYTLDSGSPDAGVLAQRFTRPKGRNPRLFPSIAAHVGLWELPPTTLVVPPDAVAAQYGFRPGLRARIAARAPMPYPSIYEPDSGKIVGMDYTLLIDAGITGDEMRAVLEYNLDLHLGGNHAPLVLVAHSHLYAFFSAEDNPDTPSNAARLARWKGLTDFLDYALQKPDVRVVSAGDVVGWMRRFAAN